MNRQSFITKSPLKKFVPESRLAHDFKIVFHALSAQTGCPGKATRKYYRLVSKRLQHEGAGYLKVLAAQPVLGLRVLGSDLPQPEDYGMKVRPRTGFPIIFGWHYQRLMALSKRAKPSKEDVLLARRLISFLSIGKMLTLSSDQRIKVERQRYALRVQRSIDHERLKAIREEHTEDIQSFLTAMRFTSERVPIGTPGANPVAGKVCLDPSCYSLKSLAKKSNQGFLHKIPLPVLKYLMRVEEGQYNYAQDEREPDGRQIVIVESGGKFRGICPYYSPLVHSSSVYRNLRRILNGWYPDVSLDQEIGHERCRLLTTSGKQVVSVDASNFTDTIDLELAHLFLELIGEDEFLSYTNSLKVSTVLGVIQTPLPMMGLKGCYELGCCLLAYSLWRKSKQGLVQTGFAAHACDDFVCTGDSKGVFDAYKEIGVSVNYKKTVCSDATAVFCGEMYWRGNRVTPVRLNITYLSECSDSNGLLQYVRDFLDRSPPVWGRAARKVARSLIDRACTRVRDNRKFYIDFALPTKLGGVPIHRQKNVGLLDLLSKPHVLRYALLHVPIHEEPPDRTTSMLCYVRLGEPAVMPDGKVLPAVTLPRPMRGPDWKRRKLAIRHMVESGQLSDIDVYEYYYS